MSDAVVFTLRAPLDAQLDMSGVTPERCADLSTSEIAALPVRMGGAAATVGDVFDVRGERAPVIEIEGDLANAVGVGARMTGGMLRVYGNVGDDAGQPAEEQVGRIDDVQVGLEVLGESLANLCRFVLAQQTVVDKNARKLRTDGLRQ